ncbi:MAG: hypothetical protein JW938_06660 [Candidatus Omnitrophica bacterium]|nr:hypothetical protein [Candidatus Omnitrophota bacterium]
MSITCEFEDKDTYLLVRAIGKEGSVEDVMGYAKAIEDYGASSSFKKLLLDERALDSTVSVSSVYEAAAAIAKEALGLFYKVACVPNEKGRQGCADFELFANNRGLNYKWFESIEEAEGWFQAEEE